jgi:hypothetical protein
LASDTPDTPDTGRPRSRPWWANPWIIFLVILFVGVPSVFIGLTLVGLFFVNPVTWFVAGGVWFAIGFRHYRHRLTIRDTPMSKIDAAAIGLVEISGRVRADSVETAPISGAPCVYWRTKIETHRGEQSAVVSDTQSSSTRCFEVEDQTGKVMIWPWAAERIIVTNVQRWEGSEVQNLLQTAPAHIREVLGRAAPADGRVVVTEETIAIGKTLYVIGVLSERRSIVKPVPFQERVRRKLQPNLGGSRETGLDALKVFALAIGGVVLGIASGQFMVLSKDPAESDPPPEIDPHQLLIWRGEQDRPFIIADTPEGVVIDTLSKWTKVGLIGGAVTMVGTVVLYLGGFFT